MLNFSAFVVIVIGCCGKNIYLSPEEFTNGIIFIQMKICFRQMINTVSAKAIFILVETIPTRITNTRIDQ